MKILRAACTARTLCALLLNAVMGATFALLVGVSPLAGALLMVGVGTAMSFVQMPSGALREGVYTEIWTGELVKMLREGLNGSWLDGVPDQSSIVNNDVIHLVDVGVDPDVLVNNDTYPIALQELDDGDIAISLDKFQTKVTPITDDELYAISYDKMSRVKESHGNAINDAKFRKAAHALCPSGNNAKSPLIKTTGEVDTATGRKRLTLKDLVELKRAMDKLKVPTDNRRLVLCTDHVNDLLLSEQVFREQYNIDRNTGRVGRLYGFDIYTYADCPVYTTNGAKKPLGSAAGTGEFQASFAFYTPRVFKATGSTKMYYSEATTDPENQRSLINFRHYFICLFKKQDAGAAIMSGYVAAGNDAPTIQGDDALAVDGKAGTNQRTYSTSNGSGVTATSDSAWLTVSVSGNKVTFTRTAYAYSADGPATRVAKVSVGVSGSQTKMEVTVTQSMAEQA